MAQAQPLPYPLRLPDDAMAKIKVIAKENGRSVNKEIEFAVKGHIKRFEVENGEIIPDSQE